MIPQAVWIASQPGLEGVYKIYPWLRKPSGHLECLIWSGGNLQHCISLHSSCVSLFTTLRCSIPSSPPSLSLSLSHSVFEDSFESKFDLPTPEREQRHCQIWGATVWNVVTPLLISFCNAPQVVALALSAVAWTVPDFSSLRCCPQPKPQHFKLDQTVTINHPAAFLQTSIWFGSTHGRFV